jgi:hypothetical protein
MGTVRRKPCVAFDHARYLAELREDQAIEGRRVTSWREERTPDGRELHLCVTYAPLEVIYVFSAANVAYLAATTEGTSER